MRLEHLLPHLREEGIRQGWSLFLPVGTIEYHGEHLPLGVDGIVVLKALAELERRTDCFVAPMLWYGVSSYAVSGPEKGTIDVDVDHFEAHVRDVLAGLLATGFPKIFIVIHHQYAGGREMPTALACKKAAVTLMMETLEREQGRGWWGEPKGTTDNLGRPTDDSPLDRIRTIPLMSPEIQRTMGYDHAGKLETSLMLYAMPELVDQRRIGHYWYTAGAETATAEHGRRTMEMIVDYLLETAGR